MASIHWRSIQKSHGCSLEVIVATSSRLKLFDLETWECEHTVDMNARTHSIAVCMQRLVVGCVNAAFLRVFE